MNSYFVFASSALLMGLIGSIHCVGMCGGFVCALSLAETKNDIQPGLFWQSQLHYSAGRILAYTALGTISGFLGAALTSHTAYTGAMILRALSGLLVIFVGLYIGGWNRWIHTLEQLGGVLWTKLRKYLLKSLSAINIRQRLLVGLAWGMLPCGLVYSALFYALTTGTWYGGAIVMLFFGLGTIPALVLTGTFLRKHQRLAANTFLRKSFGILMIFCGCYLLFMTYQHLSNPMH